MVNVTKPRNEVDLPQLMADGLGRLANEILAKDAFEVQKAIDWPRLVLHRIELRAPCKSVLTTLAVLADASGTVVAPMRVIARFAGCSGRTAERAIYHLRRKRLLKVRHRFDGFGAQLVNRYRLNEKALRGNRP